MRLLIVDDGQYIVEYLKHLLDWKKYGIDQVNTTTNPLQAKQILQEAPVDILLTDIRMPEVSGVDLLKFIHDRQLGCKVIFLSGYSDFEYAQNAIRFGAADYLLKPVDKDDMEKAILQAVNAVKVSRTDMALNWPELDGIELLLAILADNPRLSDSLAPYLQALSAEPFVFLRAEAPSEQAEIRLRDAAGQLNSLVWSASQPAPRLNALLPSACLPELEARGGGFASSAPFLLQEKNAVRSEFFLFHYQEMASLADSLFLRSLDPEWKEEYDEWETVKKRSQKLFLQCKSRSRQLLFLLEFISRLYESIRKLTSSQAAEWIFGEASSPASTFAAVLCAVSLLERKSKLSNHDMVEAIQIYIRDHIDEALNLEEIANLVHLHPVYLSKFYKQETGENLSNFLLAKRMEKAAQLLLESNLHIVDISQMVGYKKPQYFIKLFKEHYGITPYQYRRIDIK